ncbi:transcriptional regulator [Asticcacaulis sp. AC460]|uniref:LacI family DNA-binding transcriptional regulator n=1 Tax=Asticcacaulis sp. AC460 TaxID=1282360 RepID=UPI0003C4064D|nr:LacI family DNA-binding transcriptional regulator [Asticcacaulis sp. AC460]ESQ86706.1 transcriptional regulator [Asticcacaulis sp. AC460]
MTNPTIVEVARLAGVSITTVSRCLNAPDKVGKKTLAKVRKVIHDINFSPNVLAQSFRRGRTNIILVVVHEIGSWLFADILEGIRAVVDGRYSIILTESRPDVTENGTFIDMLVARQVEGVILLCSPLPFSRKLIELAKSKPLPIVIGLEPVSDDLGQFPSVHIDNHQAAYDATQYLIRLGHVEILFVSGPKNSYVTKDRELGFIAAMRDAGLGMDGDRVIHSDLSANGGINSAIEILARPTRPSAIFCANDDVAMGVMSVAAKRGLRVPEDLSVMGFDDTRYAALTNPALSTVLQPARDIGVKAAQKLLQAIERPDDDAPRTEILPHRIVVRDSTALRR